MFFRFSDFETSLIFQLQESARGLIGVEDVPSSGYRETVATWRDSAFA